MTTAGIKRRKRVAAVAALLCALFVSLAATTAPAAAVEPGAGSEVVETDWPGFPMITGPASPEEYEYRLNLGAEQVARQVSDREVVVEYVEGPVAFKIQVTEAHDAIGATVPTSLRLVEGDELITTVHHREGNPAAGGAPFVYPIENGPGWEGGWRTFSVELTERPTNPEPTPTPPTTPAPAPTCTVPSLQGLSLRTAKVRLRAADCGVGKIRFAAGTRAAGDKVVKQFRPAGAQLAAGVPVALKLGV